MSRRIAVLSAAISLALGSALVAAQPLAPVPPRGSSPETVRAAQLPGMLVLRAGAFDPLSQRLDAAAAGLPAALDARYAVVQFQRDDAAARERLRAQGVELLGYLPHNAYQVRLNAATIDALRSDPSVRWAGSYAAAWKIDPALWPGQASQLAAGALHEIVVLGFSGESAAHLAATAQKRLPYAQVSAMREREVHPQLRLSLPAAHLSEAAAVLATLDGVEWVELYREPKLLNDGTPGPLQGNASTCPLLGGLCGPTPLWDRGITGAGQIVAVADSGLDVNENWFTRYSNGDAGLFPDYASTLFITPAESTTPPTVGTTQPQRKVFAYWVQPGAQAYDHAVCEEHGTHVSGTVAGDSSTSLTGVATPTAAHHDTDDGGAPNAQLLFQDIGIATGPTAPDDCKLFGLGDFPATLQQAWNGGARLHTNSWGGATAGVYSSNDAEVDAWLFNHEDMFISFAAGNSGPNPTTVGSPGNAKDVMTVAALDHDALTVTAAYSSRGPAADGRSKPDIAAPGGDITGLNAIQSAAGDENSTGGEEVAQHKGLSGTSMATPAIAGHTALARQYFVDGWYPRGVKNAADTLNPSGVLLKAVDLNGTNTLSAWPSNDTGWGRLWLDGSLYFNAPAVGPGSPDARRTRYFERPNDAGLATGEMHEYSIANLKAGQEFRATLAWYDVAGAVGAGKALVNDLDLEVVGPNALVYKGNQLAGGISTPGATASDTLNSVEQVRLTAPGAGVWTLRVKGALVPGNGTPGSTRQGYALVVSGDFGGTIAAPPSIVAPANVVIGSNANPGGVQVNFTAPAGGPQGYQLYRSHGTCAVPQGDFRMVATGPGATASLLDDRTQGGYPYAWRVRAVKKDVEGDLSACVSAVSQDSCDLTPVFSDQTASRDALGSSCGVQLAWDGGTSNCPLSTTMHYNVQRADDPYFTTAVQTFSTSATTYLDTTVTNGHPYYYRIAALDAENNQTSGTRVLNATPSGPAGPSGDNYLDDADAAAYLDGAYPWRVTNTQKSNGSFSYHAGPDSGNYPANTCAALETPTLTLPANAVLNFKARYNLELQWDGVVTEISTDGGATWNDLPPSGGYPSDFALTTSPPVNACGYLATHGAFSGATTAVADNAANNTPDALITFKPFSASLAAYAGQNVKIRWRLSSDPGSEFQGFWLDEVTVNDGVTDRIYRDGFEQAGSHVCQ